MKNNIHLTLLKKEQHQHEKKSKEQQNNTGLAFIKSENPRGRLTYQ